MDIEVSRYKLGKELYIARLSDGAFIVTGVGGSNISAIEDAYHQLSVVYAKIKRSGEN